MVVLYLILLGVAGFGFKSVPGGFIPAQDQGYSIVALQLPTGASLTRSDEVIRKVIGDISKIDGIQEHRRLSLGSAVRRFPTRPTPW